MRISELCSKISLVYRSIIPIDLILPQSRRIILKLNQLCNDALFKSDCRQAYVRDMCSIRQSSEDSSNDPSKYTKMQYKKLLASMKPSILEYGILLSALNIVSVPLNRFILYLIALRVGDQWAISITLLVWNAHQCLCALCHSISSALPDTVSHSATPFNDPLSTFYRPFLAIRLYDDCSFLID